MKKRNFFIALMALCVALFTACDTKETPEEPLVDVTYSVTYKMESLSADFFELTSVKVEYVDNDGEVKSEDITESDLPYTVTIEGLKETDQIYFNLALTKTFTELTKESYSLDYERGQITLSGSDGTYALLTAQSQEYSVENANVSALLDLIIEDGIGVTKQTVAEFISSHKVQ